MEFFYGELLKLKEIYFCQVCDSLEAWAGPGCPERTWAPAKPPEQMWQGCVQKRKISSIASSWKGRWYRRNRGVTTARTNGFRGKDWRVSAARFVALWRDPSNCQWH